MYATHALFPHCMPTNLMPAGLLPGNSASFHAMLCSFSRLRAVGRQVLLIICRPCDSRRA